MLHAEWDLGRCTAEVEGVTSQTVHLALLPLSKPTKRDFESNRRVAFIHKNNHESFLCYIGTNLLNKMGRKQDLYLTE